MLKAITGKTIAQLDTDFRAYLDIRLAAYKGTFKLPTRGFDDVTKLEIAADAAPKDAQGAGERRARLLLRRRRRQGRRRAAQARSRSIRSSRSRATSSPRSRCTTSDVDEGASSSTPASSPTATTATTSARASRSSRRRTATPPRWRSSCARRRSSIPSAATRTRRSPQLYKKQGDKPQRARRARALRVPRADGARAAQGAGRRLREARQLAEGPHLRRDGDVHQPAGLRASLGNARPRVPRARTTATRALYTYDTMLVANPAPRRPALVHLGRAKALHRDGQDGATRRRRSRSAMKTEPENAEVLALKAKLK